MLKKICLLFIFLNYMANVYACDPSVIGCYGYRQYYFSSVKGSLDYCLNLYPSFTSAPDCNEEGIEFSNQDGFISEWSATGNVLWMAQISGRKIFDGSGGYGILVYQCCEVVSDCGEGYEFNSAGECVLITGPEDPVDCGPDGSGFGRSFYKIKKANLFQEFSIILDGGNDNNCLTYIESEKKDVCCDTLQSLSAVDMDSGYLPSGCQMTGSGFGSSWGDPSFSENVTDVSSNQTFQNWSTSDPVDTYKDIFCNFIQNKNQDLDGDGIPDFMDDDIDGDGVPNGQDDDVDGDGIPNGQDDDVDGDGVLNKYDIDIDGDRILNQYDPDMDGDGIQNEEDDDIDGDGELNEDDETPNGLIDTDGDGEPDSYIDENGDVQKIDDSEDEGKVPDGEDWSDSYGTDFDGVPEMEEFNSADLSQLEGLATISASGD